MNWGTKNSNLKAIFEKTETAPSKMPIARPQTLLKSHSASQIYIVVNQEKSKLFLLRKEKGFY
jgi:hypothetical protein